MAEHNPFDHLSFDKFRELAKSEQLSPHEKVGFPNSYREGREEAIFADVCAKLKNLKNREKTVLEIGPGCSQLPMMLAKICEEHDHRLLFVDSQEMLDLLPNGKHIHKLAGRYPALPELFTTYSGKVDVIIAYSVIQYVFDEGNIWDFLDKSLALLADGGEILFGDIPNGTMRKRFFSSNAGIACHQAFTGKNELPAVNFNLLEPGTMDDSVVLSLLTRARAQGFHSWVLPQADSLPMANRREDVLIKKP
nr:class I SAM-dependent methyltransferase [uncultured Undibacterium sp.]